MDMDIILVDPRVDPLWQKLVMQRKSSVFHSPVWMQVLAATYDFDFHAWVALDNRGEPVAGIPFCHLSDIRGERIVTLPFSDYCDPLVCNMEEWQSLSDKLVVKGCAVVVRCLYNDLPLSDSRFIPIKQAKWHGLDLHPDQDTLLQSIHSPTRRGLSKSRRDGVTVHIAERKEELRAFFDLHLGVRKNKYHLLAQPYQLFENIWQFFIQPRRGALLIAKYEGEIIGGAIFLGWKDTLYYKYSASNPAHRPRRSSDLLIWEGINFAKAGGYTYLDFGLSDWDQDGLVDYKRKFASEERSISFLQCRPSDTPDQQQRQVQDVLPQLTDLFTDESVPDSITEKAGELLYRFFA